MFTVDETGGFALCLPLKIINNEMFLYGSASLRFEFATIKTYRGERYTFLFYLFDIKNTDKRPFLFSLLSSHNLRYIKGKN